VSQEGTHVFGALYRTPKREVQEAVMNIYLVVGPALALLLSVSASGQQTPAFMTDPTAFKQELTRQIAMQENTVRQLESSHAANVELSNGYERLGVLYEDGAQWERSEVALRRAIILLRSTSVRNEALAAAISQLGSVHLLMGKLREGEKDNQEALKIRQDLGNELQIARTWNDLAASFLAQNKFEKAREFAQRALDEFAADKLANPLDTMSARFAIARALCSTKQCPAAIPLLKIALDEAKTVLGANDLPVGLGYFLLGYAYWKSGEMSLAGENMEHGTALMSTRLGWGHPVYLRTLGCYALYLHESHNIEAANVVERRIRQAQDVVDVHSIQTTQTAVSFIGLK
jgi:tetratricopeptide (TPR) repeat protein